MVSGLHEIKARVCSLRNSWPIITRVALRRAPMPFQHRDALLLCPQQHNNTTPIPILRTVVVFVS